MADANEMNDTIMWELKNVTKSDTDETKEDSECLSFQEEADMDDIPPALFSYFETSKSRAAVFEKLILEEPEELTASHYIEDMMNLPIELDKDMMKLNGQIACASEGSNTSADARLPHAPTETETLSTHNVSVCPNNEDEAGRDEYMESERHLTMEVRTPEISLTEEDRQEISEYEAEREKQHFEEMDKEERKRRIERDFQEELKRIMEAEKLHQMELELMEKRAQEKLEQELLLQQELMCDLRRRVEEEKKLREKEQKRIKDEEEKRKKDEEKIKMEAERKRTKEETRWKKEEESKLEEMKLKKEERKNEEDGKKRTERDKKRKREEERNKIYFEKRLEDKMMMMMMMRDEEKRMRKEEMEKRKMIEEARKKVEEERRNEEEINLRKEEWRMDAEERTKTERIRIEEEGRITDETEERKKQEEMRKMKEKKDIDDRKLQKKMCVEMRLRDKGEETELAERKKKEGSGEEEEASKREKERKQKEQEKEAKQVVRKREGENRKMKEHGPMEEDEKSNQEDGRNIKEEEQRRRLREEMRKLRDEEVYRQSEDEIRLMGDNEGCTGYDVDNKTNKEKKIEEEEEEEDKLRKEQMRKMEEERKNVVAEREQSGRKVGESKRQANKKTEEVVRLKEKEESKKRMMQNEEEEGRVNCLQEKAEENSMIGQKQENKVDKTENNLTSQLEDSTVWTSSAAGPTAAAATTPRRDTEHSISETPTDQTGDCETHAAMPPPASLSLPLCLPEHTEHKRLSWMRDCVSWSTLSLQNRRKQRGSIRCGRGPRRAAEARRLPPLCPHSLLQSTCWKSLQEVTTVTLEDLPGCSLSTLAQCTLLQSLTLRRCGLRSLEGIGQLAQLCYINAQENDISFVDCENMTSLRVLQLSHNKLTSIHGLTGAENLDVLHLSHNSITRIAGLESMRRLQRLSVDHNQLISTKGLRDVYTLLHLNCSYNHLATVEGLENSALLNTLDLRANSLTEPPSLHNHVLLRELHLDDNSISSLQGLTACWLPLMQHLSAAQNRITQLPFMADAVSLAYLDLRFNCMSELQSMCESLRECRFLRELHLTGNPLQQESDWRSTLHRAVPGLRAIDEQEADSLLLPPAVQQGSLASGSFLTFCQAQLQQNHDLQQQHSRELSKALSSLDAVETSCRHFTEALQLAENQRFCHEYGETTVAYKHSAAGTSEETPDMDRTNVAKCTDRPESESTGQVSPLIPKKKSSRCSHRTFDEKTAAESWHDTFDSVTTGTQRRPAIEMPPVSNHQDLDLQNTAAVMIQQLWRKHKQRCGNISRPSTAEKGGGDGRNPESGPSYINESVVGQDYAATVIQAFWRGFTLRRRLASALAAVTRTDTGEDDTFEEVDVDEFVFDETLLEKPWTLQFPEDSPPRCDSVSEQPLSLKPRGPSPDPSHFILPPQMLWRSKQAWVAAEQVDSASQTVSPVSSNRSQSSASTSVLSGLSRRSEKIVEEWGFTHSHTALLMLKRSQNMKSKRQQQKKHMDPSVRLALFRNRSYQPGPVEARNRQQQHKRSDIKAGEAEQGPQQPGRTQRAQQWLHAQASHSARDSASLHFLPEISADVLNGGRVQLVADPGYTERLHHASGLWANSSLAAQPCKENNHPRRNSLGHTRKEVPSPKRVTSAPSKRERISFRDNPVQMSGGWGGGKKRDRMHK